MTNAPDFNATSSPFKQFWARHGNAAYTTYFNSALDKRCAHPDLDLDCRVWDVIVRHSWGMQSDVALTAFNGRPLIAQDIAKIVGATPGAVSKAIRENFEQGFLALPCRGHAREDCQRCRQHYFVPLRQPRNPDSPRNPGPPSEHISWKKLVDSKRDVDPRWKACAEIEEEFYRQKRMLLAEERDKLAAERNKQPVRVSFFNSPPPALYVGGQPLAQAAAVLWGSAPAELPADDRVSQQETQPVPTRPNPSPDEPRVSQQETQTDPGPPADDVTWSDQPADVTAEADRVSQQETQLVIADTDRVSQQETQIPPAAAPPAAPVSENRPPSFQDGKRNPAVSINYKNQEQTLSSTTTDGVSRKATVQGHQRLVLGNQIVALLIRPTERGGLQKPGVPHPAQLETALDLIPNDPAALEQFPQFLEHRLPGLRHAGALPKIAEEFLGMWAASKRAEREQRAARAEQRRQVEAQQQEWEQQQEALRAIDRAVDQRLEQLTDQERADLRRRAREELKRTRPHFDSLEPQTQQQEIDSAVRVLLRRQMSQ